MTHCRQHAVVELFRIHQLPDGQMSSRVEAREIAEDYPRAGRSIGVTDTFHTEKVRNHLNSVRRLTCEEVAHEFEN